MRRLVLWEFRSDANEKTRYVKPQICPIRLINPLSYQWLQRKVLDGWTDLPEEVNGRRPD